MADLSLLKQPLTIKGITFANRYVSAPLDMQNATETGLVTDALLDLYRRRKGPALIVVEHNYIHASGRWSIQQLAVDRDECIAGLTQLADVIHNNNQIGVVQLAHAGSAADPGITSRVTVGPSAIAHPVHARPIPHALTLPEIEELKTAYVQAALRVQQARFDGVEIHGAHGYLLSQFLSPLTNQRQDEYGGNLENRCRLLLEIVKDVRAAVGPDFLLFYRLGADDFLPGGTTTDDACWLAPRLATAGVDILDVSSGLKGSRGFTGQGFFRDLLKSIKPSISIPIIGVGGLEDPAVAAEVLAVGEADFIALGRAIMQQANIVEEILKQIP
jgi:NADPH2 dehydrogenase